jgi:hypothetical protein
MTVHINSVLDLTSFGKEVYRLSGKLQADRKYVETLARVFVGAQCTVDIFEVENGKAKLGSPRIKIE